MNPGLLRNRRVRLSILLLASIFLLHFFLTHSMLTIESTGDEERTVYVRKEGFEEKTELKNSSKRFFLGSGDYEVEIVSKDSQSLYRKKLGPLWSHKLLAETIPPRNSILLGKHSLGCAKQDQTGTPVYYSCGPSSPGLIDPSPGTTAAAADSGDENYYKTLETTSLALRPFGGEFLAASVDSNGLTIKKRSQKALNAAPLTIKEFTGNVSDRTFSASRQAGFAVFDTQKSVLYFTIDSKAESYQALNIDKKLFSDEKPESAQVFDTGNFVYIFSTTSDEATANNQADNKNGDDHAPKIIVVEKKQKKVTKNTKLSPKWHINSLSAGTSDNLIILLSGDQEQKIYTLESNGKTSPLPSVKNTAQQVCTNDNESFYYLADGGHAIYKYSVSKTASFQIYNNEFNNILRINCVDGRLYFVLNNEKDDEVDKNFHYALGDKSQIGTRLDSVLPIYLTIDHDTVKFTEAGEGIAASMMYDSDKNGASSASKQKSRDQLIKLLLEKDVDATNLPINFLY